MTEVRLLLRELRQANSLSQEEVARALNISRQSIISLERGEYLPSTPVLLNMMTFFRCPVDQLFEGIELSQEDNEEREGGENSMQLTPTNNPFSNLDRIQEEMNDIVERTFGRGDWSRSLAITAGSMNIHETDKEYEIEMQTPGFTEEDINLEITDNVLTISGSIKSQEEKKDKSLIRREWQHSEFSRSVRFSHPIVEDKVEAKLENGTLTITAPKVEPIKPKVKKITVKKK